MKLNQGSHNVRIRKSKNRQCCKRVGGNDTAKEACSLPADTPLFALDDFSFEMYAPEDCPLCKEGKSKAVKPGSKS